MTMYEQPDLFAPSDDLSDKSAEQPRPQANAGSAPQRPFRDPYSTRTLREEREVAELAAEMERAHAAADEERARVADPEFVAEAAAAARRGLQRPDGFDEMSEADRLGSWQAGADNSSSQQGEQPNDVPENA